MIFRVKIKSLFIFVKIFEESYCCRDTIMPNSPKENINLDGKCLIFIGQTTFLIKLHYCQAEQI